MMRAVAAVIVVLLSAGTAQMCAQATRWTRQLGTSGWDMGYGIAVDGSGNVYVTGETEGGLDGNPSAGGNDIFVVKYDSAGVKQWVRQLGTGGWDVGYGIAVDGSGNVYVTGETEGGLDGNPSAGGNDIFVVKYDSAGVKQWVRQLGTGGWDVGYGIAVDGSGNVYVTGWTEGGLDGNPSAGLTDIFVVKYDSAGVKQWVRQLGTSGWDVGYGIAVDGSGNVYVTGETAGGLDGNPSAGGLTFSW
jgi:acyl-CoA thioesterase FadM